MSLLPIGLFARKADSLLGLDIGSTAIKLVELSHSNAGYRLEARAGEALPQSTVTAGNVVAARIDAAGGD